MYFEAETDLTLLRKLREIAFIALGLLKVNTHTPTVNNIID